MTAWPMSVLRSWLQWWVRYIGFGIEDVRGGGVQAFVSSATAPRRLRARRGSAGNSAAGVVRFAAGGVFQRVLSGLGLPGWRLACDSGDRKRVDEVKMPFGIPQR